MAKRSTAITVSQLLDDPAGVVRRVRGSNRPVRLTQRGRTQAILLSVDAYERNEREREMLRALAQGEREIASGRGFSLDRVLADADKVLTRRRG